VRRKYLADLRPDVPDELSVRIEYEGRHAYFPLSENRRAAAEGKAEMIRSAVARLGWKAASRFVREFTLAIFWLPNPLTCTYATFFTALRPRPTAHPPHQQMLRVAILEPDPQVRWALMHWLDSLPGYRCVAAHDSAASFLKGIAGTRPDLALFNDPPCVPAEEHVTERLAKQFPELTGFPFGIYIDSDGPWVSVSGIEGGYFYRRRRPNQILEPVSGLWWERRPARESVESWIRSYIQAQFGFRSTPLETLPQLTARERDVLVGLQRGQSDKAIASMLGISTWTVHTHVKSLFDKLGVHTRTEAVMKYFQK